jgi:hypothetical protein
MIVAAASNQAAESRVPRPAFPETMRLLNAVPRKVHTHTELRRLTRPLETTSNDLIIAATDLFGNDFLVSGSKIPLILGAFIRYLKHRKPAIQ